MDVQFVPESAGMNNDKLILLSPVAFPDLVIATTTTWLIASSAGRTRRPDPYFDKIDYSIDEFMPGYANLMTFNEGTFCCLRTLTSSTSTNNDVRRGWSDPAGHPKTIEELDALADRLPVTDDAGNVTRYGYIPWLDSGDDALYWPFMFGAEIYDAKATSWT